MSKKLIQRYLPDPERLRQNKSLQFLGNHLFDSNLWHLNRRSAAKAFLIGIFAALLPIPFQMVLAAVLAVYVRCNLPLSVALVWITNPLTMPFIFYFTYKVGCFILNIPPSGSGFQVSWEWLMSKLSSIWLPLYLGSLICAIIASIGSYFIVHIFWRINITRAWKQRKLNRMQRKETS